MKPEDNKIREKIIHRKPAGILKESMQRLRVETDPNIQLELRYQGLLLEGMLDCTEAILNGNTRTWESIEAGLERIEFKEFERLPRLWDVSKSHARKMGKLNRTKAR